MFKSVEKKYVDTGPDLNSMSQLKKAWKLMCTNDVNGEC